jgi:hypothetical protein
LALAAAQGASRYAIRLHEAFYLMEACRHRAKERRVLAPRNGPFWREGTTRSCAKERRVLARRNGPFWREYRRERWDSYVPRPARAFSGANFTSVAIRHFLAPSDAGSPARLIYASGADGIAETA